ncbi:MAG: PEP-CTERM sorting domain-containing protein [Fimbriimonadia bacterium]|nr:PEP-CTERM sorting domain-containing protein [Fimbriimonadia bacterium]
MKRTLFALAAISVFATMANASNLDYDADPGAGYTNFFPGGTDFQVLDDVNRTTALGIKQINIMYFSPFGAPADVTLYVYAQNTDGTVGGLLHTQTVFGILSGALSQLQFATPNIAVGVQNLWIGISANRANAGMMLTPPPGTVILGSSANVYAYDQDLSGVIDANEYFQFQHFVSNFAIETMVPEPASMIALGAGLAALAARRRRKA